MARVTLYLSSPSMIDLPRCGVTTMCMTSVPLQVGCRGGTTEAKEQLLSVSTGSDYRLLMARVKAKAGEKWPPHFGVHLENAGGFRLHGLGPGGKDIVLHHAMLDVWRQKDQKDRGMLRVVFVSKKCDAEEALAEVFGKQPTTIKEHEASSRMSLKPLKTLAEALGSIVDRPFLGYEEGASKMALEDFTDQTSCLLGALRMTAALKGQEMETAVKHFIARYRGKLHEWSGHDLDEKKEVVCTDAGAWEDLETHRAKDGTVFKLQEHRSTASKSGLVQATFTVGRVLAPWSIHKLRYRIIRRSEGMGKVHHMFWRFRKIDKWNEDARGDDLEKLKKSEWSVVRLR